MKGVSERIKRTLKRANIRTAFRPLETLSKIFKKPKDSLILKYQELFIKLSVRIVISRTSARVSVRGIPEEKNIILADEPTMNLLFKHHAETTGHDIHPKCAIIFERGILNYERRVFLE